MLLFTNFSAKNTICYFSALLVSLADLDILYSDSVNYNSGITHSTNRSRVQLVSSFFLSEVVKPGSLRKGASWQSIAGDCSDPSVRAQAKQNLVQGFISVFGGDMGLRVSNVKIACGKNSKQRKSILSGR